MEVEKKKKSLESFIPAVTNMQQISGPMSHILNLVDLPPEAVGSLWAMGPLQAEK